MPERYEPKRPAFAAWLLARADSGGWVDGLAAVARTDRSFPRGGDIEAVKRWLQSKRPSGDDWEALDDAELDYLAL
ncbi:MAG: hypothetical protein FJ335_10705 [Sphingomonadales bacterium]|nr:hypothetical protein [Sphingomonadales bacterium]